MFFNYSIINVHAPTDEKTDEDKEGFYSDLESVYNQCPKHDIKIIIGDMNAKIGQENIYRPTIGKYSLHNISNDNGTRLIDCAASLGMSIVSTYFQHRRIHKMTWRSPDGVTYNQIDHVLIDIRHATDVMDVRSFRGANMDSDHYLVGTRLRARICNIRKEKSGETKRYNLQALKRDDVREKYTQFVSNQLGPNMEQSPSIEDHWNQCKDVLHRAAETVIKEKPRNKVNDWFDEECKEVTEKKTKLTPNCYNIEPDKHWKITKSKEELRKECTEGKRRNNTI